MLDQKAVHVFSMMGVWLTKFEASFPAEPLSMSVLFPYVYISFISDMVTLKIHIL